ncbi:hypothetical protein GOP47_0030992 [Adiantum capillus-veneris]|nr:hypothetical protein GOP47_0030992 [Adiantum capillus-veneris]
MLSEADLVHALISLVKKHRNEAVVEVAPGEEPTPYPSSLPSRTSTFSQPTMTEFVVVGVRGVV